VQRRVRNRRKESFPPYFLNFELEISKIAIQLLEEIFDIKGFSSFKEFKKDSELIEKIKMTDKNIIEDAAKGLWENSIEKFNEDDESEKQSLEFSKQIYCFLNECF
jgi:hypothetical protein